MINGQQLQACIFYWLLSEDCLANNDSKSQVIRTINDNTTVGLGFRFLRILERLAVQKIGKQIIIEPIHQMEKCEKEKPNFTLTPFTKS